MNTKKVICLLLTVVMLCSIGIASVPTSHATTYIQYGDFYYTKETDGSVTEATVSKYQGTSTILNIPSAMHSYKVVAVDDFFIKGNKNITSVILPDTINTIKMSAFEDVTALASITIPANVSLIDVYAFAGCTSLTSYEIKSPLINTIPIGCFSGDTALAEINLNGSITTVKNQAFTNCSNAKKLLIGNNVTTIEPYAFVNCTGFEEITIGDGITSLDFLYDNTNSVWLPNEKLKKIVVGRNVTNINDATFASCGQDLVMYGYLNSYAQSFANSKGITFVAIDDIQPTTAEPTTNAPTTAVPTTATPTSVAPTTEPSTTAPASTAPVTDPSSAEPTSVAPTTAPSLTYILGDANTSGAVDISDATHIQRYCALLITLTSQQLKSADSNGDSSVNIKDATLIQRYLAGFESNSDIGKTFTIQ